MDEAQFWEQVQAAARAASRAYLATVEDGQPHVRVVFPAFEGRRLWIATQPNSAKARHIRRDSRVELFFEVGPRRPITHLTVTGRARIVDDAAEKRRLWDAGIFDYNLREFWPDGPGSPDLVLLLIEPSRVELGMQPAMWQGGRPRVWRAK